MSGYIRDRWLWFSLGIALAALYVLQAALYDMDNDDRPIKEDEEEEDPEEPPAVMSLSLKTLRTLVDSPNPNISQMAIDLIRVRMQDRTMNAEVYSLIRADAKSEDPETCQKALTTLKYLREDGDGTFSPEVFSEASTSSPHLDGDAWTVNFDGSFVPSQQLPIAGWTAIPRERPVGGDDELRRSRREAVVLHEGAGEISEDDIIRPLGFR